MTSTTTIPDVDVFPTVTMPITVVLTRGLLFVIVAWFLSIFFWRCLLNQLSSAWTLQRTPYGDLIHVTTPPENTGLDLFIIKSFHVFLYSYTTMRNQCTECAICLSEFSDEYAFWLVMGFIQVTQYFPYLYVWVRPGNGWVWSPWIIAQHGYNYYRT